jgi:hypothetical protein
MPDNHAEFARATPIRPSRDAVSVAKRPISEISSDQGISIHGTYEPERPESFRPCAHGTAPQRIGAKDLPSRSRLSYLVSARRPPTNRRRDRHVRRRQPETLAGSATRGFVDGFPADEHPALRVGQWSNRSRTAATADAGDCSLRIQMGPRPKDRGSVGVQFAGPPKDNPSIGPRSNDLGIGCRLDRDYRIYRGKRQLIVFRGALGGCSVRAF